MHRGEKKILNTINTRTSGVRYFVPDPANRSKPKQRITLAAEKIFIMVRPHASVLCEPHGTARHRALSPTRNLLPFLDT
jgi:hypothetical protein